MAKLRSPWPNHSANLGRTVRDELFTSRHTMEISKLHFVGVSLSRLPVVQVPFCVTFYNCYFGRGNCFSFERIPKIVKLPAGLPHANRATPGLRCEASVTSSGCEVCVLLPIPNDFFHRSILASSLRRRKKRYPTAAAFLIFSVNMTDVCSNP